VIGEDINGIVTSWNNGAERVFGYSKGEVMGQSISLLSSKGSISDPIDLLPKVLEGGFIKDFETSLLKKDGGAISVSLSISPVHDEKGRIVGLSTIAIDNTVHKIMGEDLKDSEDLLLTYLNNSPEGIFIVDEKGNYQDVNKKACSMLKYGREELLGLNLRDILDKSVLKEGVKGFQQLIAEGAVNLETVVIRKDGERLPIFLNAVGLPNHKYMAFCTDITDRKRIEEAWVQANKKLTLLSNITRHDINNQITVLLGNLELLEKKHTENSLNPFLIRARTAAERISASIKFTKTYEDIGVHAPVWRDVRKLVDASSYDIVPGHIKVVNDIQEGIEVLADPLILNVFVNLIDNAVRHGGNITTIRFYFDHKRRESIRSCVKMTVPGSKWK
jgi:PAS domain S-box-containing protein